MDRILTNNMHPLFAGIFQSAAKAQAPKMEIEEWSIGGNYIKIIPVEGQAVCLTQARFETWADDHSKRDWGTIDGEAGTYTWDEYYGLGQQVEDDLLEYMDLVKIVGEKMAAFDEIIEGLKS